MAVFGKATQYVGMDTCLDGAFVPGMVDAAEALTTFVDGDDEYAPTENQLQPWIAAIEQARNSP